MLGFDEFELDLAQSLLQQLPPKFANLAPAALTNTNTQTIPDKAQGAYLLFQKGVLVYVGKSDAEMGLRRRLERHSSKIQQRKNLVPADIEYKALSIFSFHVMDAETLLIKHYSSTLGTRPAWNDSGFGANDPGRERDTTKVSRFDSMYPIDIDFPLNLRPHTLSNPCNARDALQWLATQVPYVFRIDRAVPDLAATTLNPNTLFQAPVTMRSALQRICSVLKPTFPGWQATALPGWCIFYKEHRMYSSASASYNS